MVREGIPFVLVPLGIAMILVMYGLWVLAVGLIALAAFMAFFFRDPARTVPEGDDLIVSAADGRVTRIEDREEGKFVSVFLSPMDVHINRSPISGKVIKVAYIRGKKRPATSDHASAINERNSVVLQNENFSVTCTQIAGILARRIVCWSKEGDELVTGQRFGLIKFGSRTDLLMPPNTEIAVKVGDRVRGGETVIGRVA
jgi:phosphatidylserine decarboxylase